MLFVDDTTLCYYGSDGISRMYGVKLKSIYQCGMYLSYLMINICDDNTICIYMPYIYLYGLHMH